MKRTVFMLMILALLLSACGIQQAVDSPEPAVAPEEPSAFGIETFDPVDTSVYVETIEEPAQEMEPERETNFSEEEPSSSEGMPPVLDAPEPQEPSTIEKQEQEPEPREEAQFYVEINGRQFSITLDDSPTAEAFRDLIPAVWDMEELHGNEKFIYLDGSLPSNSRSVGYIETGDLMLYGDSCIVLFYDSFSTSYGYTRIGWVDDPDGLPEIVGNGDITASFGLE